MKHQIHFNCYFLHCNSEIKVTTVKCNIQGTLQFVGLLKTNITELGKKIKAGLNFASYFNDMMDFYSGLVGDDG